MEEWQKEHVNKNLYFLIHNTNCDVSLFARLTNHFSDADRDKLEAMEKDGKFKQANLFYELAKGKVGIYNDLMNALEAETKTGAYRVLLMGTLEHGTWNDIPLSKQQEMRNKLVNFQGSCMKLDEFGPLDDVDGNILIQLENGQIPTLVNNQVPNQVEYYMNRTIKSGNILKCEIFQRECKDVFVIQGLQRSDLTVLAGNYTTDDSRNQISKNKLSVKFILLNLESHFQQICKLTSNPVHWIKYQNEMYELIKSSGSVETPQKYIHQHQHNVPWEKIISSVNKVVILADSPGMGKTILLAKLAEEMIKLHPKILVRFIILKDFMQVLDKKEITIESIASIIAEQSSEYEFGKVLVKNAIKSGNCILIFDGFDEVLLNLIDRTKQVLKILANLKSASLQLFVTTRPHMREELENTLVVIGYTIQPFIESDQLEFLIKFWKSKGIPTNESVEEFAKLCLKSLVTKMTDFEKEITGIPLQCRILAEIYLEEAKNASAEGCQFYQAPHSNTMITTIFKMYEKHIKLRFEALEQAKVEFPLVTRWLQNIPYVTRWLRCIFSSESLYQNIIWDHMYLALKLLFPEHTKHFQYLRWSSSPISLELCRYGILEWNPSTGIQFVHRTFAEFFVAWFVIEADIYALSIKFLLSSILSTRSNSEWELNIEHVWRTEAPMKSFQFDFPVVCYFINEFAKNKYHLVSPLTQSAPPFLSSLDRRIVDIVSASAFHDYPYLLFKVHSILDSRGRVQTNLNIEDIFNLLLTAAKYSDVELMELFCDELDPTKIKFQVGESGFQITPLHIATQRGHYNLVEYLITWYGIYLPEIYHLFHFCVAGSGSDNETTLIYKKQIIKLLRTKQRLDERADDGNTPIMQNNVHFEMIECLIEEGADVNLFNQNKETVLHKTFKFNKSSEPEAYHRIIKLLYQEGFQHFNLHDKSFSKAPPIHYAVQQQLVELLDKTMRLLHEINVEFNAVDKYKNSVLHKAIEGGRSVHFIKILIEFGVKVSQTNSHGEGVLHVCAGYGHLEALQYFLNEHKHNLDINAKANYYLETPLHIAFHGNSKNLENTQRLLITNGADVNAISCNKFYAKSNDGSGLKEYFTTPFMEGFRRRGISLSVIQLMEERGLMADETIYSYVLKLAVCNTDIKLNAEFADVLDHLIDKGGSLGTSWPLYFMSSRWKKSHDTFTWMNVRWEILRQFQVNNFLTEVKRMEIVTDSTRYHEFVEQTPGCLEKVLKLLVRKQSEEYNLFEKIRDCLRNYFNDNEKLGLHRWR